MQTQLAVQPEHKPQVGDYFFVEPGEPTKRVIEVFAPKGPAWFVKSEDGSRYLVVFEPTEGVWFCLMKCTHGNF